MIISIDKIRARLSLPDFPEAVASLKQAVSAAQLRFEAEYITELQAGTLKEFFYLTPKRFNGATIDGLLRVRLSKAFVKNVKLYKASTHAEAMQGRGTLISDEDYILSPELGLCYLNKDMHGSHLMAEYDYGFSNENDVPEWVTECIASYTSLMLLMTRPAEADVNSEVMIKDHIVALLNGRKRLQSMQYTSVVDVT